MTPKDPAIAVGYWRTRGGEKAYVAALVTNPFTGLSYIAGWIDQQCAFFWCADGRSNANEEGAFDLIAPWTEPVSGEAWISFWPDGSKNILLYKNEIGGEERQVKVRYTEIADEP
jgi:hypothetical protein